MFEGTLSSRGSILAAAFINSILRICSLSLHSCYCNVLVDFPWMIS